MWQNCWEFKHCSRSPGGSKVKDLGVCPASIDIPSNGLNGGRNGGRFCWAIAGTLCNGKIHGSFAEKRFSCISCEFFKKVRAEVREKEGPGKFQLLTSVQKDLLRNLMVREIQEN